MFLVFNKEKIISYVIAISAVAMLFIFTTGIYSNKQKETVNVSANATKQLPVYSVDTNESKLH